MQRDQASKTKNVKQSNSNSSQILQSQKQNEQLTTGEKLLFSLGKAFNLQQTNKIDQQCQDVLAMYADKIMEKRKQEREKKQQELAQKQYAYKGGKKPQDLYINHGQGSEEQLRSINTQIIEEVSEDGTTSNSGNYSYMQDSILKMDQPYHSQKQGKHKNSKVNDYKLLTLKRNMKHAISEEFIFSLSEFFSTKELVSQLRLLSQFFNKTIKQYLPNRLQQEAEFINAFLEENDELNKKYLKIVDTQIPIAKKNWLVFDFQQVINQLRQITKEDITNLKNLLKKPLQPNQDQCLAPICLLFGLREDRQKLANGEVTQIWHKQAYKLISNQNFLKRVQDFGKDILKEEIFLEVFEFLNRDELEIAKVQQLNQSLAVLIKWARSMISYHILVHPYKLRNHQTINPQSDIYQFLQTIDSFMDQFYQLKTFLIKISLLPKDTNFAFNLSHVKFMRKEKQCLITKVPNEVMSSILCFLSTNESVKICQSNRRLREYVADHWDTRLSLQMLQIESYKTVVFEQLNKKIPLLYEGGFFSPYIKMLDRILMQEKSFLSKYHLEEIRTIFKPKSNMLQISIFQQKEFIQIVQAFCILTGIKPNRKGLPDGSVDIDYFSPFMQIAKGNKLQNFLNSFNKLTIKNDCLQQANSFVNLILQQFTLSQLKSQSLGLFQLFLWVMSVLTYNKLINPLNFITSDYVKRRMQNCIEDVQAVEQVYQFKKRVLNYQILRKISFNFYNESVKYFQIQLLSELIETWRFTFEIRCKNIESFQKCVKTNPEIPYENKQNLNPLTQSIENICDQTRQIIQYVEEYQGINILRLNTTINNISQGLNESIYFQVTQDLPEQAKPAFFEKILIDFFENFIEFEKEATKVGDPQTFILFLDLYKHQQFLKNSIWT